jgi:acetyltransferase-like isoleucine patch superfamily enzyme
VGVRALVGAGAVVVDDIPAFSVAVGAPARVVDSFGPEAAGADTEV